jgi:hypothetical protein
MKKTTIILAGLSILLMMACKDQKETPKVIYEKPSKKEVHISKPDSSEIAIADLPIQMEGTKYMIHPVGDYRVYDGGSKMSYGSSNTDKGSFSVSNYNRFELTGFLQNLKFQHIDSTAIRPLTDKKILIETATFLNTIAEKTKHQLLVYTLVDQDTNQDGVLNSSDIKSLYISKIDGSHFMKLSADFQELIDWNLLDARKRLYFRTIEDTNKNGQFDKDDVVHYNFVDLISKEWTVMNYNPI